MRYVYKTKYTKILSNLLTIFIKKKILQLVLFYSSNEILNFNTILKLLTQ